MNTRLNNQELATLWNVREDLKSLLLWGENNTIINSIKKLSEILSNVEKLDKINVELTKDEINLILQYLADFSVGTVSCDISPFPVDVNTQKGKLYMKLANILSQSSQL